MRDEDLVAAIRNTTWIADLLTEFDFDLRRVANGPAESVHLASGEPLEMIAGDASGGAFMVVGRPGADRPVMYVGSEGEGGLIANNLRDALALVVGLSSLHDATALPVDDGGTRLRAWLARTDAEVRENWPNLDADRSRLRDALGLPSADGLLGALHIAAADDNYRPISDRGDVYESMVG
jgi:hypothetical protein